MVTSNRGIEFIKAFESCRLTAYKALPQELYYTIGYGHCGPDVTEGMTITAADAEEFLRRDLGHFEAHVSRLKFELTQDQFDALVSFAYNCGAKNLRKLTTGRTISQIADAMLLYNKAGGKVLKGLTRRREAERALFLGIGK